MVISALVVTGGLHMDGFMDTCDAIFSRQDRKTRLNILSDSHSGAFAVMGCVVFLLLQSSAFADLFEKGFSLRARLLLCTVPLWSRLGMGLLLNSLPFAKEGGIARALGSAQNFYNTWILLTLTLILIGADILISGWRGLLLPGLWGLIYFFWRTCCLAIFGGIAGDLLGAFNILSETLLILLLSFLG